MQLPNYLKGEELENTSEKPTEDTDTKA